jgi:bilirubin oxidase
MGGGMGMGGGMRGMGGGMGGGMMGPGMGMMGMMSMAHPIHLHGQQFQIIERSFDGDADARATYGDGFVDSGWKDTVLVAPGERVKIAKPFGDFKGRFMYHCHNLEHEDMGMMREFSVE